MKIRMLAVFAALAVPALGLAPAAPSAPPSAVRFDFEQGTAGQAPDGWVVTPETAPSYTFRLTGEKPDAGRLSAVLASTGKPPEHGFGWTQRALDAAPYRGKRVRFRAAVRTELGPRGQRARLFLATGRAAEGAFDATSEPITGGGWAPYQVVVDVPRDAKALEVGIVLVGDGQAFLDSGTLEVLGEAGLGNEPARPLSARGLENLAAFARLYGYVRFFHPSDPAAAADWDALALAGVQAAEKAPGPAELAAALERLFRPVAPAVRVFPTSGGRPPLPPELAAPAGGTPKVTAWEHHGVALSKDPRSIYRSERKSFEGADAPDPAKVLEADLGGGVSALVPTALYVDAQGTLPHAAPGAKAPAPDKPEGFAPTGDDRTTRLADVVITWNVFQHFYPYFDVVQTDWPAELRRALSSAAADADARAFLGTLRRLVAALHDGHGNVFHPVVDRSHSLPLAWDWVEGELAVTRVDPAQAPGLAAGDVVTSLGGRPAREVLETEEALVSGATPQWRRWVALANLLSGPANEEVKLGVRHADGTTATVALRRSAPSFGAGAVEEPRPEKIAEVEPGIFYVDIGRIDDDDFNKAVDRLAAAHGVVFDLRGYPSKLSPIVLAHLTDKTITSARWLVPVVTRPDHQDLKFDFSNWPVQPAAPRLQGKVAFVTDGRAISYAETYMGIVESYKLAAIVGGRTAGTNGNINPFTVPGGYRLIWTGMKVEKHDGSRHHGVGIQPTVPVSRTLTGVRAGRDELLEKAIEVVSSTGGDR